MLWKFSDGTLDARNSWQRSLRRADAIAAELSLQLQFGHVPRTTPGKVGLRTGIFLCYLRPVTVSFRSLSSPDGLLGVAVRAKRVGLTRSRTISQPALSYSPTRYHFISGRACDMERETTGCSPPRLFYLPPHASADRAYPIAGK